MGGLEELGSPGSVHWACLLEGAGSESLRGWVQRKLGLLVQVTRPTCVMGAGSLSPRCRGSIKPKHRSMMPTRRTGPYQCKEWSAGWQTMVHMEDMGDPLGPGEDI